MGIHTRDINVVLRVPKLDLNVSPNRDIYLQPWHTTLPREEYLTMLVTLDFVRYGRLIPSAISKVRRALQDNSDTVSLLIEFLDFNCAHNGLPLDCLSPHQEDAREAWRSEAFHSAFVARLQGKRYTALECLNQYPDIKTYNEAYEDCWGPAAQKARPIIVMGAEDAEDARWWTDVMPALRQWLKSDEFYAEFRVRFGVLLLLHAASAFY